MVKGLAIVINIDNSWSELSLYKLFLNNINKKIVSRKRINTFKIHLLPGRYSLIKKIKKIFINKGVTVYRLNHKDYTFLYIWFSGTSSLLIERGTIPVSFHSVFRFVPDSLLDLRWIIMWLNMCISNFINLCSETSSTHITRDTLPLYFNNTFMHYTAVLKPLKMKCTKINNIIFTKASVVPHR